MNKVLKIVILLILLVSGLIWGGCFSDSEPPVAVTGKLAPDFQLRSRDGQSVSLSDFRGKPVLINFWTTWCPPCRAEMPYLQEIYDDWSGRGLVVLTVNVGESPSKVREFMQAYNLSLPMLLDTEGATVQKYTISAIPITFFIDKDGIIQAKIIGAFPSKEAIEKTLVKIMP